MLHLWLSSVIDKCHGHQVEANWIPLHRLEKKLHSPICLISATSPSGVTSHCKDHSYCQKVYCLFLWRTTDVFGLSQERMSSKIVIFAGMLSSQLMVRCFSRDKQGMAVQQWRLFLPQKRVTCSLYYSTLLYPRHMSLWQHNVVLKINYFISSFIQLFF